MFGIRIGEVLQSRPFVPENVSHEAPSYGSRLAPPGDSVARPAQSVPVLRLRGGGGALRKAGDREGPLPESTGGARRGRYDVHREAQRRPEVGQAETAKKRQDIQRELDAANQKLRDANRKYDEAAAEVTDTWAEMQRLGEERRLAGANPARRNEVELRYQGVSDDHALRSLELSRHRNAMEKYTNVCLGLERKLSKLPTVSSS